MIRRTYCRCTTVQNYSVAEAADKLKCSRRWLEKNISRLPRQKIGGCVAFCDCELALIQATFTVLPDGFDPFDTQTGIHALAPSGDPAGAKGGDVGRDGGPETASGRPPQVKNLSTITPSGARRHRAVS